MDLMKLEDIHKMGGRVRVMEERGVEVRERRSDRYFRGSLVDPGISSQVKP